MSESLSPVGQLIALSKSQGSGGQVVVEPTKPVPLTPKPMPPTPRDITWVLKDSWVVGEEITRQTISLGVSAGPDNAALTAPLARLDKGGSVTVTAVAPAAEGFAEAKLSKAVTVRKLQPKITWRTPLPVKTGTRLGPNQLDAAVTPNGLGLGYTPGRNTAMNAVGDTLLKVAFAGDDGHAAADAQVTVSVLSDDSALAKAIGESGMLSGRAHRLPPELTSQAALQNWHASDPSDPTSMKVQAKEIMANIHGKTPKELLAYMDTVPHADKWVNDLNAKGNPRTYPNVIWKLPNGLQIRYKPNGDGKNGLTDPMFCIEGRRTDITGFSTEPDQSAFKVMPNGEAAPWGPRDTDLPDQGSNVLNREAMDSACKTTHLYCTKMQDQVVTWPAPGPIEVGTALSDKQLNATALDGVVPSYSRVGGGPVVVGDTLVAGTHTLRAATAETLRYKAGQADVQLTVTRKAQALVWKGAAEMPANGTLSPDDVTALGKPAISFELDGTVITGQPPLPRGQDMTLIVRAAETAEYAAGEVSAKLTVKKSKWVITWNDPPDIRVGEKLTAQHLGATAVGAGLFLEYANEMGDTIKIGDTLDFADYGDDEDTSAGQDQELTVTAKTSAEFESTSMTVKIKLLPKLQEKPAAKGKNGRKK
jgi:hypothetical protein